MNTEERQSTVAMPDTDQPDFQATPPPPDTDQSDFQATPPPPDTDQSDLGSFDAGMSAAPSPFASAAIDESSAFPDAPAFMTDEPKKKRRALPFIIVAAVLLLLIAAAVIASPLLFLRLGDAALEKGDRDRATDYYELCFGRQGSEKRLNTVRALDMMEERRTEDAIRSLLENGIAVNVSYDLRGGAFVNSNHQPQVTYTELTKFGNLYQAKKDCYSFAGWELSRYSYAPTYDDAVVDVSLTAAFTPNTYKISYTNLFSDTVDNPAEYTVETGTITLKNPSRVGYTFLNWSGTDIDGATSTVIIPQGSSGNRAYIANWAPNRYKVTLEPDVTCQITTPVTVTYDAEYELPTIDRRGYTHTGWSDGTDSYFKGYWQVPSDISLVPTWTINIYGLTYELNGGKLSKANPADYTVETADITLTEPTRYGYTFQGWLYGSNTKAERNVVIRKNSVGDMNFSAVWKGNPHKMTLNVAGGTGVPSYVNVVFGDSYSLPTPTRYGYTFQGWYDGSTKRTGGTWDVDEDDSVTASWSANKYSLSLNANGGYLSGSSMKVTFDSSYSLPTPTRYGYTFLGWYSGSDRIASSGSWKTAGDLQLKAAWQGNTHTVWLDPKNGNLYDDSISVVFGDSYTLPTPTRYGYTFKGWYDGSYKHPNSGTWNTDEDMSLTASWTANTHRVYFDANGGSVNRYSMDITFGSSYTLPTPTRKGYTFEGWYDGSTKSATKGTWNTDHSVDLVAKWKAKVFTITFDPGDGETYLSSATVAYNNAYYLPIATRTGYTFEGWYDGSTKIPDSGIWTWEKDMDLTARWKETEYTITLDANGGSVYPSYITVCYRDWYSLPTPTRYGYRFLGWYYGSTRISDSGTWYYTYPLTLTAKWERR